MYIHICTNDNREFTVLRGKYGPRPPLFQSLYCRDESQVNGPTNLRPDHWVLTITRPRTTSWLMTNSKLFINTLGKTTKEEVTLCFLVQPSRSSLLQANTGTHASISFPTSSFKLPFLIYQTSKYSWEFENTWPKQNWEESAANCPERVARLEINFWAAKILLCRSLLCMYSCHYQSQLTSLTESVLSFHTSSTQ